MVKQPKRKSVYNAKRIPVVGYHGPENTSFAAVNRVRTHEKRLDTMTDLAWNNRTMAASMGGRTVTFTEKHRIPMEHAALVPVSMIGTGAQGGAERIKALMRNIADIQRKIAKEPSEKLASLLTRQIERLNFVCTVQANLIQARLDARQDRETRERERQLVTVSLDGKRERFTPAKAGMVRLPLKADQ